MNSNNPTWTQILKYINHKIALKSFYISSLQNRYGWENKSKEIYNYAYDEHENKIIGISNKTANESNNGTTDKDITDVSSSSVFENTETFLNYSFHMSFIEQFIQKKCTKEKRKKRICNFITKFEDRCYK